MTSVIQVVVKTRTEYQTEKKRLKVPKVEEFTISFTDGVSERLKVRNSQERRGPASFCSILPSVSCVCESLTRHPKNLHCAEVTLTEGGEAALKQGRA